MDTGLRNRAENPAGKEGRAFEQIGPYMLEHDRRLFPLTKDPFLLCDFVLPLERDEIVLDIGTGTAVIPLILAHRSDVRTITGVEVQKRVLDVAGRNVRMNGLGKRITLVEADYRDLVDRYPSGFFTLVVSNPPYIKSGAGRLSPCGERTLSRHEVKGSLSDLVRVSAHLVSPQGRVSFIYPVERLDEAMDTLEGFGLRARRLRFVHTACKRRARLFMVEAGHGSSGLRIEEPVSM